jgi:hypothetical protein
MSASGQSLPKWAALATSAFRLIATKIGHQGMSQTCQERKSGAAEYSSRTLAAQQYRRLLPGERREGVWPQRARNIIRNCSAEGVSAASRTRMIDIVFRTFHRRTGMRTSEPARSSSSTPTALPKPRPIISAIADLRSVARHAFTTPRLRSAKVRSRPQGTVHFMTRGR